MNATRATQETSISSLLSQLVDQLGRLVSHHFALAHAELVDDARSLRGRFWAIFASLSLLVVGYGMVCCAVAITLGARWGLPLGFLAVGALNLLVGGAGAYSALSRFHAWKALDASRVELAQTAALLSTRRGNEDGSHV